MNKKLQKKLGALYSRSRAQRGFTLVELLIVMAIIAVLVGITIAGLGYAMRRSRNIARMSAMENLDRAIAAYYSDELEYPIATEGVADLVDGETPILDPYLEGSWETPAGTQIYYNVDSEQIYYTFCVNQEETGTSTDTYNCTGNSIGRSGFPASANGVDCEGSGSCGIATCCDADGCVTGECN